MRLLPPDNPNHYTPRAPSDLDHRTRGNSLRNTWLDMPHQNVIFTRASFCSSPHTRWTSSGARTWTVTESETYLPPSRCRRLTADSGSGSDTSVMRATVGGGGGQLRQG